VPIIERMAGVRAFVLQADLALEQGRDPASVGAAVTVELCGGWEHDGSCRWPHSSAIDADSSPARFRRLFVADDGEAEGIHRRIEMALRSADGDVKDHTVDEFKDASTQVVVAPEDLCSGELIYLPPGPLWRTAEAIAANRG
jgi:hypothetical protein